MFAYAIGTPFITREIAEFFFMGFSVSLHGSLIIQWYLFLETFMFQMPNASQFHKGTLQPESEILNPNIKCTYNIWMVLFLQCLFRQSTIKSIRIILDE